MDQPPQVASTKSSRQAAFRFVFAVALMNAVSFGIMIPVLPNLISTWSGATPPRPRPGTCCSR